LCYRERPQSDSLSRWCIVGVSRVPERVHVMFWAVPIIAGALQLEWDWLNRAVDWRVSCFRACPCLLPGTLVYHEEINRVRANGVSPVRSVSMMWPGALPLEWSFGTGGWRVSR
jgi:hypothetical protein